MRAIIERTVFRVSCVSFYIIYSFYLPSYVKICQSDRNRAVWCSENTRTMATMTESFDTTPIGLHFAYHPSIFEAAMKGPRKGPRSTRSEAKLGYGRFRVFSRRHSLSAASRSVVDRALHTYACNSTTVEMPCAWHNDRLCNRLSLPRTPRLCNLFNRGWSRAVIAEFPTDKLSIYSNVTYLLETWYFICAKVSSLFQFY